MAEKVRLPVLGRTVCLALQAVLFSDGKCGHGKNLAPALPSRPNFRACFQLGPELVGLSRHPCPEQSSMLPQLLHVQ